MQTSIPNVMKEWNPKSRLVLFCSCCCFVLVVIQNILPYQRRGLRRVLFFWLLYAALSKGN
jgi:hypothetical protein